jgi:hypothetical protein
MSYHAHLGTLVQKVFELYFNQQVNLRAGGRKPHVIQAAADKILPAYYTQTEINYPWDKNEEDLTKDVRDQLRTGFQTLADIGVLTRRVRSEVKLTGVFRGFRMFGLVDFLAETAEGDMIFDGKGHQEKTADPRQIVYYALNRAAAGNKVIQAGLIYWRHGFEPVDTSPAAIRHFVETDFTQARPIFELLKHGTNTELETKPDPKTCKYCPWSRVCQDSYYRAKEVTDMPTGEVGFGELDAGV